MEFKRNREFVVTLSDQEASELESDLLKVITYHGNGGFTRRLYCLLKTRNEDEPSDDYKWLKKDGSLQAW